jgi:CDP-glycerol glycerophosphotransferase (TagB/SpsB family)
VKFNEKLSIAEDVTFISDVVRSKMKYGVVQSPVYYYRKRTDGSSAIGSRGRNKSNYMDVTDQVYRHILNNWADSGSSAMEYTVLYDLSYRLNQKEQSILSPEEEKVYKESIIASAIRCSNESIVENAYLNVHQKLHILTEKYGKSLSKYITIKDGITYFDGKILFNHKNQSIFIDFLTHQSKKTYKIEGFIAGLTEIPDIEWYVKSGNKKTKLSFVSRSQREESFLGDTYYTGGAFEVSIDIPLNERITFIAVIDANEYPIRIETGPFTKFGALKLTYRHDTGRLFKRKAMSLESYKYSTIRHISLELRMLFQILLNWRLNTAKAQLKKLMSRNLDQLSFKARVFEILKPWLFVAEAIAMIPRAFLLRTSYYIVKPFKKRPIWLISDRGTAAGDNGEALFKYIMNRDDCPADVYFVISKKSKDLDRLQSIGKVIYQEGLGYKLKFLLADKIIASQADVETTNPFIRQLDHYVDLFNFDFVFLQHGIIRHNLSSWLNRFNKNINLFITSAQIEYDSIFINPYYYSRDAVLLSGLPRYDYLEDKSAGKLILAPTYRKNLVKQKTDRLGRRGYDPTFKKTFYREFYNNLMNDERILEALRGAHMTGEFYLHPVFSAQRQDFDENDVFTMMRFPYDYKTAFSEGNMLISDHSSVVFDFAYLKKPVVYAHFDVDTFFEGHSYDKSNFFSDEEDGFGGVYYDYETLVQGVVETIKSGTVMDRKYKKRVDSFFYKVDKNNSERVYDAIIKLNT